MNYKIKIGPVDLPITKINQHKNFDAVYQKYQYTGSPNSFWNTFNAKTILTGLVSVGVIMSVIYYANYRMNKSDTAPFVNPPFPVVQTPFTHYKMDASKGGRFEYQSGSIINVPAGILINKKGEKVKGEVQIKYREFANPKEFFLSGIPMNYDTGGKTYAFESAGMFEMRAFQNEEPLFIQKDKAIQVDLIATHHGDSFCLYYLNEDKRKWDFKGNYERKVVAGQIEQSILDSIVRREMQAENKIGNKSTPPSKPIKADPEKFRFNFGYDKNEFPELTNYDGITFEIKEGQKFSPSLFDIVWPDIKIERLNSKGSEYELTLSNGKAFRKFMVYPVIEDSIKYEEAMREYDKKYKQYKMDLGSRQKQEKLEKEEYEKKVEEIKKQIRDMQRQQFLAANTEGRIINSLRINGFGIVNCDRPTDYPNKRKLKISFVDIAGEEIFVSKFYLVDQSFNSIFPYINFQLSNFGYDPSHSNMIYTALGKNKLGIVREIQFKEIPDNSTEHIFKMEIVEKEFEDMDEIWELLSFQKEL